jgi:hypothetical protein
MRMSKGSQTYQRVFRLHPFPSRHIHIYRNAHQYLQQRTENYEQLTLIRFQMIVDIICRWIILRITADVGAALFLIHPDVVNLKLCRKYQR